MNFIAVMKVFGAGWVIFDWCCL